MQDLCLNVGSEQVVLILEHGHGSLIRRNYQIFTFFINNNNKVSHQLASNQNIHPSNIFF